MDEVTEDRCVVCRQFPTAERAQRRVERFSTDYVRMPTMGVCELCQLAFWQAITGCEPPMKA